VYTITVKSRNETSERKGDHLEINISRDVTSAITNGLEKYRFIHNALPELNFSEIDTSITIFNRKLGLPFLISSMTGGTKKAGCINRILAEAAQQYHLAMGVGSQRIGLEDTGRMESFNVRKYAPDILLFANLGAVQLNYSFSANDCKQAIETIQADGLILHLNPLQEAMMENGDTNFSGLLKKIEMICKRLSVPVVIKEVGWGISAEIARKLLDAGAAALDVAGAGGTSWSEVEMHRAKNKILKDTAAAFRGWGIPTAEALVDILSGYPEATLIASGGIKDGIDIAKCIALGASIGGMAHGFLTAAADSAEKLHEKIEGISRQFRTVMFATGSKNIKDLRNQKIEKFR